MAKSTAENTHARLKVVLDVLAEEVWSGESLNAGQVFIGNIGGAGKRQFTVLGSPVNLAARFESETKALESPIVVGQDFYTRLPQHLQAPLMKHENRPIKGTPLQTVYTYTPTTEAGQKEIV